MRCLPFMLSVLSLPCVSSSAPLPALDLPAGTLLLREHIGGDGPERTGNWRERIDASGCWSVAHNTWLWVTDPALRGLDDPLLFYNSEFSAPWFCLADGQLARLRAAASELRPTEDRPAGPVERWTVVVAGTPRSVVVPAGRPGRRLGRLASVVEELAREGVWGQSPEGRRGGPP